MVKKENLNQILQVAGLFLRLGSIGFGGTAVNIALMEEEAVTKRGWLSREHFLDLLSVTNLVPGPNAVEMACFIGRARAGLAGLVAGGVCFILPAFLFTLGLAWLYRRFGDLPQIAVLFYGVTPAVMAVILVATYRLGQSAIRDWKAALLAALCLAASFSGIHELLILLASGLAALFLYELPSSFIASSLLLSAVAFISWSPSSWDKLIKLALFSLKTGSFLFGSGMLLYAFIQRDVVERYGWLSRKQLIDAIAVGQITPGPVLSSLTFIGYLIGGLPGALVSTIGVFLPSFLIVALLGPWVERLRNSALVNSFLKGVNAAVVSLLVSVALSLLPQTIKDWWSVVILALGLLALFRFKVDSFWVVIGGGILGILRHWL